MQPYLYLPQKTPVFIFTSVLQTDRLFKNGSTEVGLFYLFFLFFLTQKMAAILNISELKANYKSFVSSLRQ